MYRQSDLENKTQEYSWEWLVNTDPVGRTFWELQTSLSNSKFQPGLLGQLGSLGTVSESWSGCCGFDTRSQRHFLSGVTFWMYMYPHFKTSEYGICVGTCAYLRTCIGKKTLMEKEKRLVTSIFSFPHNDFKRSIPQGRENQGLFAKSLGKVRLVRAFFFCFFCYTVFQNFVVQYKNTKSFIKGVW